MRIGEVAEQHHGGTLVGVGDDACAGESCLSESVRRHVRSHELLAVQFPAEGGAGVLCGGILAGGGERKGVFADHLQDACGGDPRAFLDAARCILRTFCRNTVVQDHLYKVQQVGHAAEHACATDREKFPQHPGAFVMDFTADFAAPETADFRRRDFTFGNRVPVACKRVPAGTCHAERNEEPLASLLLQVLALEPLQNDSEQHTRGVSVVEVRAGSLFKLVRVKRIQDSFCRECTQRLHGHAVIEAVGQQMKNANVFSIVCL